ncbi:MAG: glycosyltransferase [Patescibacteria group bacterium]
MSQNIPQRLSVIIPVFNERKTVEATLKKVLTVVLPQGWSREVIVVDDGSTDGSRGVIARYTDKVKAVFRAENGGKAAALRDGLSVATGDFVLIQDADLEYDPEDYGALLKPIIEGKTKVVFGSRVLSENAVPFSQIYFYGGLLVTKIFNLVFRSRITDIATCYKVFPKEAIPKLLTLTSSGFIFDVIDLTYFLLKTYGTILEIPISYHSRKKEEGKKMNWRHGVRCLRHIFFLWFFERSVATWSMLKNTVSVFQNWILPRPKLTLFLIFSLFFTIFCSMYFSVNTVSSSDDHFFHFRFAQQMLDDGFFSSFSDFKSIYLSKMAQGNTYFVYYNFLFYLFIIPFTFIAPLYAGIKLYAVCIVASAFALLYWCFKKFEIQNPFVWTLIFIAVSGVGSIWRFFLSRPYALAPSLLILLLVFLYRKNYIGAFIVAFAYMYWHSASFFLPACVALGYLLIEKFYGLKGDYKNLFAVIGGTTLAIGATFLVSSGFMYYMKDIIFGTYVDTIIGKKVAIAEGGELYPADFFNFIQANTIIFAAFVTALVIDVFSYLSYRVGHSTVKDYLSGVKEARRHLQTCVLILTALFFLGTVVASARFGDYFTMFAALYIALSFDYARRNLMISGTPMIKYSLATALSIVLVYLFTSNMLFLQQKIAYGAQEVEFYKIGSWLKKNTEPGSVVLDVNWSWFPQLYYHSPRNNYISGLEPRFTYDYSPHLYWLSVNIPYKGYVCDQEKCPENDLIIEKHMAEKFVNFDSYAKTEGDKMASIIRNQLGAEYVVSQANLQLFNYILEHNANFEKKIYDSEYQYILYQVKSKNNP